MICKLHYMHESINKNIQINSSEKFRIHPRQEVLCAATCARMLDKRPFVRLEQADFITHQGCSRLFTGRYALLVNYLCKPETV